MVDKLVVWEKSKGFGRKYDIFEVLEDFNGLKLKLYNVDKEEQIELVYDSMVCTYKSVDESFWINIFNTISNTYGSSYITQNTFFEVTESSYAIEIEKGTCGAVSAEKLHHLKIIAANSIFDIIAFKEPRINRIVR